MNWLSAGITGGFAILGVKRRAEDASPTLKGNAWETAFQKAFEAMVEEAIALRAVKGYAIALD